MKKYFPKWMRLLPRHFRGVRKDILFKWFLLLHLAIVGTCLMSNAASITLEWNAVTTNADQSPIADLAGYRLFQSTNSLLNLTTQQALLDGSIIKTVILPDTTSHLLNNLSLGSTYFFRVTAFNTSGNESGFNVDDSDLDVEVSTFLPISTLPVPEVPPQITDIDLSISSLSVVVPYLPREISFDTNTKPGVEYMPGNLINIRVKVDDTEKHAPILKISIRYSETLDADGVISFYTRVHEMKKIGDGIYAGYVDTRNLVDNRGLLRYKVEILQDNGEIVTTQEKQLRLATSIEISSDATGAFQVEDGNPFDGELKVSISHEEGIERVEFKKLMSEQYRAKIEEEIDRKYGDKPVAVYDVSVPGRVSSMFKTQASLTLVYNDLDGSDTNGDGIPDGDGYVDDTSIPEQDLRIFWHDGVNWRLVGGEVDTAKNTVTARVKHFSVYGLFSVTQVLVNAKASEKFLSPALQDGINDLASFGLKAEEVTIYDVRGRKVFLAAREQNSAITWDCRDGSGNIVESGIYIAKIKQNDGRATYQILAVVK